MRKAVSAFAIVLCAVRLAHAQAWVPPQGVVAVTLLVQEIDHTGHRLPGLFDRDGKSVNRDLGVGLDYAFTDRWSISLGLPFVGSKYLGPNPPPLPIPDLAVDHCRCWHRTWQDVSATSRFNVISSDTGFAFTPSVAVVLPTHNYDYQGEAVAGRHLTELDLAVDAAQRLDWISTRLAISGHYSYAVVERVLDIPNNRSNVGLDVEYAASRRLSLAGVVMWQHTHGGVPVLAVMTGPPELLAEHDRLLRDNSMHAGGRVSYSFRRLKIDVFGSYIAFVSGMNTHAGRAITVGITRWFGL